MAMTATSNLVYERPAGFTDTPMVRGKEAIREGFRAAFQRVSYERFECDSIDDPRRRTQAQSFLNHRIQIW